LHQNCRWSAHVWLPFLTIRLLLSPTLPHKTPQQVLAGEAITGNQPPVHREERKQEGFPGFQSFEDAGSDCGLKHAHSVVAAVDPDQLWEEPRPLAFRCPGYRNSMPYIQSKGLPTS